MGDVLSGLLAERALTDGVVVGRLVKRWAGVVGDRLARETAPARLEAGILTVSASSGPWGAQVGFLSEEVRKGANRALGTDAVRGVRVVVQPGGRGGSKPL